MELDSNGDGDGGRATPWIGGGEMARLIAAIDWSTTPLGPLATWPSSLSTAVGLMLACPNPALLVWGPGHVALYNDAYRALIKLHHPVALGADFRAQWAEFFPLIGAAYQDAWAGRPVRIPDVRTFIDRDGFLEEGWCSLAFSPISGSGAVTGVFHLIVDETVSAVSGRRRRTLVELASRASKARTTRDVYAITMRVLGEADLDLPFVLLYVVDDDGGRAGLIGQGGLSIDTDVRPAFVERDATDDPWRIAEVLRTGATQQVELGARLVGLTVGPYPEVPTRAVALPVARPGSDQPVGVLVVGLSARRPVDDAYLIYCDLVGAAVSAAVANAHAYEEAQGRLEALAALDRLKTAFFSNVSHELRTPLTLILAPIEDARRGGAALVGDRLDTLHRNAVRLLRLVNDLLDFARLEAARLESTFEPTDLAHVTAVLAEGFREVVEPAGLTLTVDCPPLAEPVYVDREQWEKIVTNLIANAFKFTLTGGIAVWLGSDGDRVELRIADTGTGIPAHELPRIFERFHRVDGAHGRSIEGSGIGLALVHALVAQHRGAVTVISEVGVGTTFTVSLTTGVAHLPADRVRTVPRRESPWAVRRALGVVERIRRPSIAPPDDDARALRPRRILVVDDNDDLRDYLLGVLAPLWDVEGAPDGRAALARALVDPPELVLADVMMPELDGFGLLRALRADPRTSAIPVVLLSARPGEDSLIDGLDQGANDYLVKPFSARELVARIRIHVETARLRRELAANARELDAIIENLPDMVFVKDADRLAFTRINRAGEALLGVGRDQLIGKTDHDFFPPDQAEFFIAKDRETLAGPTPVDIVEEPIETLNGRRWLHTKKMAIVDDGGRPRFLLGISEDITERRHQQQELVRAKEVAEAANRELEAFSRSVAHDLRAPLRGIDGFAQALTQDYADKLDERGLRYLTFVRESAQRMGLLIDGLLHLSRVTRSDLVRKPVDLTALAREAFLRLELAQPERIVTADLAPGLIAEGDPPLLTLVFDNLLGNAWKFTGRRADPRIELGSITEDGRVIYFVRDNGAGFDETYVDKLFGVFQRLHSQAEFEGTGIGLATVQRIIHRHGGKIWARGKVGDGATFYFTLREGNPHE